MTLICSVADCGKPTVNSHGWCNGHYQRWWKHGDPLGGKVSPGTVYAYYRDVVLKYDGDECLTWPFATDSKGSAKMQINRRLHRVARLVCEEEHGPAPEPNDDWVAAHSCGKGHLRCVARRHLSWKTHAGNSQDMHLHGTSQRGEKQWASKLTVSDVREIFSLKGKVLQRDLAERFHVSRVSIADIHAGRTWSWLTGKRLWIREAA